MLFRRELSLPFCDPGFAALGERSDCEGQDTVIDGRAYWLRGDRGVGTGCCHRVSTHNRA